MPSDNTFETFLDWLDTQPYSEQRRFLEEHGELLHPDVDGLVNAQIAGLADELQQISLLEALTEGEPYKPSSTSERIAKTIRKMRDSLEVLREVREREGTEVEAVRTVYVDRYSGLVLDMPPWLQPLAQEILRLSQNRSETAQRRFDLLRQAFTYAQGDQDVAPETLAELQVSLGNVLGKAHQERDCKWRSKCTQEPSKYLHPLATLVDISGYKLC